MFRYIDEGSNNSANFGGCLSACKGGCKGCTGCTGGCRGSAKS